MSFVALPVFFSSRTKLVSVFIVTVAYFPFLSQKLKIADFLGVYFFRMSPHDNFQLSGVCFSWGQGYWSMSFKPSIGYPKLEKRNDGESSLVKN
jgi:hypothetical protein